MGSNSPESKSPKPGGLLARLFGVNQKAKKTGKQDVIEKREEPPLAVEPPRPAEAAQPAEPAPAWAADSRAEASPLPAEGVSLAVPVAPSDPVGPGGPTGPSVPPAPILAEPAPAAVAEIPQTAPVLAEPAPAPAAAQPLPAEPVPGPVSAQAVPMASPAVAEAIPLASTAVAVVDEPAEAAVLPEPAVAPAEEAVAVEAPAQEAVIEEAPPELCPICSAVRKETQSYCDDCGWMFPANAPKTFATKTTAPKAPMTRIKDRYELGELLSERGGVSRYRGLDHGSGKAVPVTIVRMAVPETAEILVAEEVGPGGPTGPTSGEENGDEVEILPDFDAPALAAPVAAVAAGPAWPGVAWEEALLEKVGHPSLPQMIESFVDGGFEYLILEVPEGRSLWDAWDDPDSTFSQRFGILKRIAEGVHQIHQAGALFEALRPDLIVVTDAGQVKFTDLDDLLPLPLPQDLQVRVSLYTPPELVLTPDQVDARADLYSFGAMIYALEYLRHELAESDFERQFSPKLITDRFPDIHPAFFRLVSKTFVRDPGTRFPTDEAVKEDPSGFKEMMRTLEVCGRALDTVRLDIAAWTTTGMVRTGNEDAFGLLHAVESRQDDLSEYALILLADGMGGYEAGEVAAAMAISALRKNLLGQKMFAALAGDTAPPQDQFTVEGCKKLLQAALEYANKEVYTASRTPGVGKRGMGCTAEAVYVDAHNVVVGHVGDSRTYHLAQGRLIQLTRDQTFVNRMVELGALTPEEAEDHPRKNELQQAIGGQPTVQPGVYHGKLKRNDWILVCSDGLTNHIPPEDLQKMLLREATSAEEAARRLLNLVNLRGATDNATVVIIRAC
jgi:protein phosphatase